MLRAVYTQAERVQDALNFNGSASNPQFRGSATGKTGTAGFFLGLVGGVHLGILLLCGMLTFWRPFMGRDDQGESKIVNTDATDITRDAATMATIRALMQWSMYVVCLCFFHFAEFFVTAVKQPKNLKYDSFLLNHSVNYTLANVVAWIEYFVELWWWGGEVKNNFSIAFLGLCVLMAGQSVRSIGMWQCGENFSHEIMTSHDEGHRLITTGIYSKLRHPAYFGWFYWTIGTQLLLCNPLCTIMYAYVSWRFFSKRIPFEEDLLHRFYGDRYLDLCEKTIIGIPMIK